MPKKSKQKSDKSKVVKQKVSAKAASKKKTEVYGADQITVLEGLEPVRKRPGMYIGNTAKEGLHHLIWEVVDNAIDEAMAGRCDSIVVTLLPDGMVSVEDNGAGIPVEKHKVTKVSALETVMTKLHAGGKFGQGGYKVSGGLHGVGVSVVNALSEYMKAEVKRGGKLWRQEYVRGKPKAKVKAVGTARSTGTIITFKPDPQIFTVLDFDWRYILDHLRQQAYLTKGVKITVIDKRQKGNELAYTFYFEGGIASYVRHLNRNKQAKHQHVFYVDKTVDDIQVEVALQYVDEYNETTISFANNIYTVEGGMHLQGFKTALTRTLNKYARDKGFLKEKDNNLTSDDVREGLTAVVSVKLKEPQFEGQTKAKLGNAEVRPVVDNVVSKYLFTFLEEHPRDAEAIIAKCLLAQQARQAARVARESVLRKGALDGLTLPGKLADCSSRSSERTELFIVEGDSAGGSAKQGRDREFQAILPLRGKILNVEKARLDKMLANNEIKSLVIALGTNIGEKFNIDDLRYDKIIIMTDADVDGAHIRTLLLTIFYRYFPEIITQGHLYIAQPPLYKIQKGKTIRYAYSDEEKEQILKELGVKKKAVEETVAEEGEEKGVGGVNIQRYKGLGEMNPEQLWETTMNPSSRVLLRVTIEDAARADEVFSILMGSDVLPRKKFISTHAKAVRNLDV